MKRTPMPRPTKPMTRSRLNRKAKPKPAPVELYLDGNGVAFLDAWRFVRVPIPIIKGPIVNAAVCTAMHARFSAQRGSLSDGTLINYGKCWLCGVYGQIEAHHILPRYDVLANIIMAGGRFGKCLCHSRVQDNPATLGECLRAKWEHDPLNCDWLIMLILRGQPLPDLPAES